MPTNSTCSTSTSSKSPTTSLSNQQHQHSYSQATSVSLGTKNRYLIFLRTQCAQFQRVLLVPGNNEFYHVSRSEGLEIADTIARTAMLQGRLTVTL